MILFSALFFILLFNFHLLDMRKMSFF